MALNDVHDLTIAGKYCGQPVAINMAYKQLRDDALNEDAGRRLIARWFDEANGAWTSIRFALSSELVWECATSVFGGKKTTAFLQGATGNNAAAGMPSPQAIQVNVPAENPHPDGYEGRFFMPGLAIEHVLRSSYQTTHTAILRTWMLNLLRVDDDAQEGPRYQMVPHAGYLDAAGTQADILAGVPYFHPFIKVIGNRRADACTTFTSSGGAGFDPIVVPPPTP